MAATDRRLRGYDGRMVAAASRLTGGGRRAAGAPVVELVETPKRAWGAERRAAGRRWLRPTGGYAGTTGRWSPPPPGSRAAGGGRRARRSSSLSRPRNVPGALSVGLRAADGCDRQAATRVRRAGGRRRLPAHGRRAAGGGRAGRRACR